MTSPPLANARLWKDYRVPLVAIFAYAAFTAAVPWLAERLLDVAPYLPTGVPLCLGLLLGPPLILWGRLPSGAYVWATLLIAICLLMSWATARRYPHSKIFAIGLVAAALVWVLSALGVIAAAL